MTRQSERTPSGGQRVRRRRWGTTLAAAVVLTVAVLAGCTSPSDEPSEQDSIDATETLRDQVADLPDVQAVQATYQDNLTAPGTLRFTVEVPDTVDRKAMGDMVMGMIWQSTIDPLESVTLNVGSGSNSAGYTAYVSGVLSQAQIDEFNEQYGDRPN